MPTPLPPSREGGIFIITRLPGVTLRSPPAVNCRPFRAQKTACERGRICRAYVRYRLPNSGHPLFPTPEHEVLGNPQGAARIDAPEHEVLGNPQGAARIDAPEHEVLGNPQHA